LLTVIAFCYTITAALAREAFNLHHSYLQKQLVQHVIVFLLRKTRFANAKLLLVYRTETKHDKVDRLLLAS
jgi:hypothetical protein